MIANVKTAHGEEAHKETTGLMYYVGTGNPYVRA
mgnify:CR=1 FL=1